MGLQWCGGVNWDAFAAAGTAALAESSQALRSGSRGEVASTDVAMMLSHLSTAVPTELLLRLPPLSPGAAGEGMSFG